jgi:hypothetical protein
MNRNVKDIIQYVLGAIVVICFFILVYFLMTHEIPTGSRELLNLIIGALIGSFTTVVTYFYGSSKGSAEKDVLLNSKKDD